MAASLLWVAAPAQADEVEDALEAYRAGDLATAKEEIDFAAQLIAQQKAAALGDFLPQPLPGWERRDADSSQAAVFGGMMASAV